MQMKNYQRMINEAQISSTQKIKGNSQNSASKLKGIQSEIKGNNAY
jgi:hypothetical protein